MVLYKRWISGIHRASVDDEARKREIHNGFEIQDQNIPEIQKKGAKIILYTTESSFHLIQPPFVK